MALVTELLGALDQRAFLALYGGMSGAWAPLMIGLTILGAGWTALALLPLAAFVRTRAFAQALAGAIAVQAVLVWALKLLFGRVRPWLALHLAAPIGEPRDGSFPSGHAAGSFCVAAFVAMALPAVWSARLAYLRAAAAAAWTLAALIAFSRVYLGAHFPGDVVAGALLGALVGRAGGLFAVRRGRDPLILAPPADVPPDVPPGDASPTDVPARSRPGG
jgi:undecaprenyl-diphosphatase